MTDPNLYRKTYSTPTPKVRPPRRPFALGDEVDNEALAALLIVRGVVWPIAGFAPGMYTQTCHDCDRRHTPEKRSIRCLPCAVVAATAPNAPPFRMDDVLGLLTGACALAGSQKAWAAEHDLSDAYVSDVLLGKREPGASILAALGLEKTVTVRQRQA